MTSALAPLIPIVTPHFRKGAVDLALIKHQAIAVAVGLAVRWKRSVALACMHAGKGFRRCVFLHVPACKGFRRCMSLHVPARLIIQKVSSSLLLVLPRICSLVKEDRPTLLTYMHKTYPLLSGPPSLPSPCCVLGRPSSLCIDFTYCLAVRSAHP